MIPKFKFDFYKHCMYIIIIMVVFPLILATLECVVCIGADYPTVPPIFAIAIKLGSEDNTQNIQIKVSNFVVNVLATYVHLQLHCICEWRILLLLFTK